LAILFTLTFTFPIVALVEAKPKYWTLDPIIIDDWGFGDYTWEQAASEPWCMGSGRLEDPYIIKKVVINGEDSPFCMVIRNSETYFKIMECKFYNTRPSSAERNAGLVLVSTQNGKILKNQFIGNGWPGSGMGSGIALLYSYNNEIQKNLCSENAGPGIYLESSNENVITQNLCKKNEGGGISIGEGSAFNEIIKNDCIRNGLGIILFNDCTNNEISDNLCSDNKRYGIQVWINSNYNTISNNDCRKNLLSGILVGASHCNIISQNTCKKNGESGISIIDLYEMNAENNIIYGNTINNNLKGIFFSNVDNNDILRNFIYKNTYGIILDIECENNLVYHNNLIKNVVQAWDFQIVSSNKWYHPYMLEGNYWSDYRGVDEDEDGLGDTPFGYDEYPLMEKNGWEYMTPEEEEILNVVNRLGADRTVYANETSYIIYGVGQLFSERIENTFCPPYTAHFNGTEAVDSVWFFREDVPGYSEPSLMQLYYIKYQPYYFTDELGLIPGYYEFEVELTWYDCGELNGMSFITGFYLV